MTVYEAIRNTDELYPNVYSEEQKALWLEELDRRIFTEIFSKYTPVQKNFTGGYSDDTDKNLLIEGAFDGLYLRYLVMQFDIAGSDITRYQNSAALFNTEYGAFINHYNKTHKIAPLYIKIE